MKDQMPFRRFIRNLLNGGVFKKFQKRSHLTWDGKPKIAYGSKESAIKAATKMGERKGRRFSYYKCFFCEGYHIGGQVEDKLKLAAEGKQYWLDKDKQ